MEFDHLSLGNEWTRPTASIETITPEKAEQYLRSSVGNRSLRRAKIDNIVRDLMSGCFCLNGETIIFDEEGRLMDGHHRLTACVKCGVSFKSVIVRGIERANMKTLDVGAVRANSDHLQIDGFKHSTNLSSIINLASAIRRGSLKGAPITSNEMFVFIKKYPEVLEAVRSVCNVKTPRVSVTCGVIYFVAMLNGEREIADRFINVLKTGIPAYEGDPCHALRERIFREEAGGKAHRITTLSDLRNITYRAWELFRTNRTAKKLLPVSKPLLTGWTIQ